MICPDCGFETDFLTSQNRCKQCSTRYNQVRYLNKRNGTNRPYVPLKNIKGTPEYNRAMAKRKKNVGNKPVKTEKEVESNKVAPHENQKNKFYAKVAEDLTAEFEKNNINKSYIDVDLSSWINTFWSLLQDDGIVFDAVKANKVFDDLSYLYMHNQLNISWDDEDVILENSLYQKAVLELRRPTKDFIVYWKIISDVIKTIKSDEALVDEIRQARNELNVKANFIDESPIYHTEIETDNLNQTDNIKVVDKNYKYYNIKVTVKGLYGHNYTETFKLDTPMYAKSPEHAKSRFVEFMNDKFPGVKYKEANIKTEEIK